MSNVHNLTGSTQEGHNTLQYQLAEIARYCLLSGLRRQSGVCVRQATWNRQTRTRNPATGEEWSESALPDPAKPRCVGSLARLPRRAIHSGSLLVPHRIQIPEAWAGISHRRLRRMDEARCLLDTGLLIPSIAAVCSFGCRPRAGALWTGAALHISSSSACQQHCQRDGAAP